ncbi:hypothetical protein ACIP5Y_21465 [Nocardia sp. NPDC088792]|uniref:hypothetical protein n=1 Tax=Nocardia sp. NPDC088792 TaxID=3364332 RepID=UPI00381C9888
MTDPLLNEDGTLRETWNCLDCKTTWHLHSEPAHPSHDAARDFIREHEYVHAQHLAHHGGDRSMMRLALKYPALHAAIIQVHGPVEDLHPDHRAQILRAADIAEDQ